VNIRSSEAIRAGLIGAAAGFVIGVLSRIPFLGCIIAPLSWVAAVGAGVLYVYYVTGAGAQMEIVEGAVGGGLAGAIAGVARPLVQGVLNLIFGTVSAAGSFLGGEGGSGLVTVGASVGSLILGVVAGAVSGAILGAVGGLLYALIKKQ